MSTATMRTTALLMSIFAIGTMASPTMDRRSAVHELGVEKRATYTGTRATYYDTSVGLGSCGILHQNSEYTVAMNSAQMSDSACGQTITITYNGKTTQASVEDTCPTCPYGGLDLSEGLFSYFASQDAGVIYVDWSWGSSNSDSTTSSTYVAPTTTSTSYTPTSTYTPTTTSSTYVAPTSTYEAPTTTSTTPTSTYVAPTSTSTSSESSSSTTSSSTLATSSLATTSSASDSVVTASTSSGSTITALTTIDDPFVTSTATVSSASASGTGTSTTGTGTDSSSGGNLLLLSEMIVNLGRVVVISGQGGS